MDREASARSRSTRPPSAVPVPRTAMVSAASRPITQQGLTGLRPAQMSNAGTNRIYRDKRYYMSLIQAHMNEIKTETERLKKKSQEYRIAAINKEEYRRIAEENAKKYAEQQELLSIYNTVLDLHMSKARIEDIQSETSAIKKQNEETVRQLENMFSYKMKIEEEIAGLKKALEEEDKLKQSYIDKLSPKEKEEYLALESENKELTAKIKKMQDELKTTKQQIEGYMQNINMSREKQEKLRLMKKQALLEEQKAELTAALETTLTPEQQREMLLQQVKADKADTETLSKAKKNFEEELEAKKARLAELEHELDGKDNARLKKHKELRERGEHMAKFIASFDEKFNGTKQKVLEAQEKILTALECLSISDADLDIENLNVDLEQGQQTSLENWTNKYKLLSSQLAKLEAAKEKMKKEMESLRLKKNTMENEIETFRNVDGRREELTEEKAVLEEKYKSLQAVLESTNAAVAEAERRKEELDKKLQEDKTFVEIQKLEKQVEVLEKQNEEASEKLMELKKNDKVEDMRAKVKEMIRKRNEQLIQALKKKKPRI